MSKLRVAVIGCGHLGRIHARLISDNDTVELVGVVDPSKPARDRVAQETGVPAAADIGQLPVAVDAAILAAPTGLHAELAVPLLRSGIDLLIEKPLTVTSAEAERLCEIAEEESRVLAVGHVERFNPAFITAERIVSFPTSIQATRRGGFAFRSMDVGVVLDLMIHDLELILALVPSPILHVRAHGTSRLTEHEDYAVAELEFQNGCVAHLNASRVSPDAERTMAIYGPTEQVFIDFGNRSVRSTTTPSAVEHGLLRADKMTADQIEQYRERVFTDLLPLTHADLPTANPLADEQHDFFDCVRQRCSPRVNGRSGALAVRIAEQILAHIHGRDHHGKRAA